MKLNLSLIEREKERKRESTRTTIRAVFRKILYPCFRVNIRRRRPQTAFLAVSRNTVNRES